jgi:hypothetical protein
MTLDLPSLQCWLRARIGGRWQPPTMAQIQPLPRADSARVRSLIEEVIAAHPAEYFRADGWQEKAAIVLSGMLPKVLADVLDQFMNDRLKNQDRKVNQPAPASDPLNLGL